MPLALRLAENPKEMEAGKAGVLHSKTSEPTVAGSLEDFRLATTVVERRQQSVDISPLRKFEGGTLKILYFIGFFDTMTRPEAWF